MSNRIKGFCRDFSGANIFQKAVFIVSLLILVVSMTQPAFYIDTNDRDAYANAPYLFFLGWMSFIAGGIECIIWLANPLYFIALYLYITGNKLAVVFSALSIALSLIFATLVTINTDESGGSTKIASIEIGYKLWVSSIALLLLGIVVNDAATYIRSRYVN